MSKLPSLLQRIEEQLPTASAATQIDIQAKNCFSSAIKLFDKFEKQCSEEDYQDLKKRFLNALKSNDYRKFDRGFKHVFHSEEGEDQ